MGHDENLRMDVVTVSKAKAGFSKLTRRVIKSRKAVLIRTPAGFVQIVPYDLPEEVAPAPRGSLGAFTPEELRLHNTFGESL
jgi:hypothetical protein